MPAIQLNLVIDGKPFGGGYLGDGDPWSVAEHIAGVAANTLLMQLGGIEKSLEGVAGVEVIVRRRPAELSKPDQTTGTAYLEKHTTRHAWFGTLGDEVASVVITKPAWIALGKPNSLDVVVRATPDSTQNGED